MYKCLECGNIFEDGEQTSRFGVDSCPLCNGAYEETTSCKICGSAHLEDELNGGVCDECIDEYRKDFDTCYEISLGETEEIKINSLLASLFEVSDIEQILKEHIRYRWSEVDCSEFIDADKYWFGTKLLEEVKK